MNENYFDHHNPNFVGYHNYNGEDPNDYEFEKALRKM